ncbi:predicted protein [Chaetoceros tenuissimus]|uniref:Uncharacterized protein n=1 Tax=Chaetoceros tenuissimus TaxID=426638 RepID=A0AAD3H7X1_9STRA|nr:predicted protein [Chaetoceros tenuissimus]
MVYKESFLSLWIGSGSSRSSSDSSSLTDSHSPPSIGEDMIICDDTTVFSLDGTDSRGGSSSVSSFSFSLSSLSFRKRNPDVSNDDFDEDLNLKSFSNYDDDISTSSAEGTEEPHEQLVHLRRKLEDSERQKQDLLNQCLKLQRRVSSPTRKDSDPVYLTMLKKDNDKLKAEKSSMENEFANDVKLLLNRMNDMDIELSKRDKKIVDLENELRVLRARKEFS